MSCLESIKTLEKFRSCHNLKDCSFECDECSYTYTEDELMAAVSEAITIMNEKQISENLNG